MAAKNETDIETLDTGTTGRSAGQDTAPSSTDYTADPLLGPEGVRLRPGNLMVKATIEVHTHMALNLYRGRQADPAKGIAPIIGLIRFAKESVTVWKGASMNDPLADYILLQCEEHYELADVAVTEGLAAMQTLLSSFAGLNVNVSESDKPVPVNLNFASPWAWKGALLLRRFDEFCRAGMTARHLGLLSMKDWEDALHRVARKIRRLFLIPSDYIFTGIRRDVWGGRIKRARKMYERANKVFPIIPDAILKGVKRASVAPPILRHMDIARREKQRQRTTHGAWEEKTADDDAANAGAEIAEAASDTAARQKLTLKNTTEKPGAEWFDNFHPSPTAPRPNAFSSNAAIAESGTAKLD